MRKIILVPHLLVFCAIGLLLGGCASTPAPRFYTLNAFSGPETAVAAQPLSQGPILGLGPIRFPDYLDRPGIVTRTGANTIKIAEFDLWAGSLKENFSLVLVDNLSRILQTDKIALFPFTGSIPVDIRVLLTLNRFEGNLGGEAVLEATWVVQGGQNKKDGVVQRSAITEPVDGSDYLSLVAAQSRAVAKLGREIAQAIQGLPAPAPPK